MKLGWCPARRLTCTLSTEAASSGTCTAFQFRESLTEATSLDFNLVVRDQEDGGSNPLTPTNPFGGRPGDMGETLYRSHGP